MFNCKFSTVTMLQIIKIHNNEILILSLSPTQVVTVTTGRSGPRTDWTVPAVSEECTENPRPQNFEVHEVPPLHTCRYQSVFMNKSCRIYSQSQTSTRVQAYYPTYPNYHTHAIHIVLFLHISLVFTFSYCNFLL